MAADSAIALRPVRAVRLDLTFGRFQFWSRHEVMLARRTTEFKHAQIDGWFSRTSASRSALMWVIGVKGNLRFLTGGFTAARSGRVG